MTLNISVHVRCPHCWIWSDVGDNCTACGGELFPLPDNAIEQSCGICGALVMWPADDDMATCQECIRVAVWGTWEELQARMVEAE